MRNITTRKMWAFYRNNSKRERLQVWTITDYPDLINRNVQSNCFTNPSRFEAGLFTAEAEISNLFLAIFEFKNKKEAV